MSGVFEFATYWSEVPGMGRYAGTPSNSGVKEGPPARSTLAVWGIELAISASWACGVPAIEASTTDAGVPLAGICLKEAGSASAATNVHGPERPGPRYHRPASST